jgi:predicted transcriptional regulator
MTTAKISAHASRILNRLQKRFHKPKTLLIDQALKSFEDQLLLEEINEGYARLKADKKGWKEELEEREELQGTIRDGLEDES